MPSKNRNKNKRMHYDNYDYTKLGTAIYILDIVILYLRLVGAKSFAADISGVKVSAYSALGSYIHTINTKL